ncbi:Uncharacterised protein [Campylobacter hyointestinalis subsp. hyointestinalis]|uniref:Uncharacterized protein n=1 Tax=Campylobacter hyointestinalis subsp. hyointestinalis TaxID=91352 RepID=A0A0S4STW8_CAMHY|nr:hypothetical protein [Campylobacter hyointestinalis]CUU89902.1 Uncharacterised protein [Campylobacter hyointestinalis subsp. hyointestinalis]
MENLKELKNQCTKYVEPNFYTFEKDEYKILMKKDICKKYFFDIPAKINSILLKINGENKDLLSIHELLLDHETDNRVVEVNKPIENISIKYWFRCDKILGIFILLNVPNKDDGWPIKELEITAFTTDNENENFF